MAEKRDPMSPDLLRQRRNLLITSLILIAINLAGASLKKDISVLGASIEFTNPERIVWGVWIIWSYFFVRYWQYLNEEPDLGIHKGMEHLILRKFPHDESETDLTYWISWKYLVLWNLREHYDRWDDDDWRISLQDPKNNYLKIIWAIQAFFSVATKTPRFTDYGAPFLVAIIAFAIAAFNLIK